MVEMISRIKNWIKNKRFIRSVDASGFSPGILDPIHKEDLRAIHDVKSFNKSFDKQQQQMQSRAMVPHEAGCDPISCKKVSCFKYEPDKVIKKTTVKMKRTKIKGD